ncbi:hypothetical protein JCM31185_06200 [Furfurilactobacillus curtus]|uniref:YfhO family protein n=2 Tax=Furfurilactobacillus curtus TaxID=1746200 RepID=A0ABQ5JLJ4_9LACO
MGNLGYLRDMNWTNYSAGSSNFIDDYFGISNIVSDPHQSLSSAIDNDDYMGHSQPVSYADTKIKQNNRKGLAVTHHTEALPLLFPLQKNNTSDKLNASVENVFQNQNILATGLFARKIMSPAKVQAVSNLKYSVTPTQDGEVYLALPATNFPNFLEWAPINIQRNDFKKSLVTYNFGENSVLDLGSGTKNIPFMITIKPTIPNVQINQPIIASSPKESTLKNALLDIKNKVKTQRVSGNHIRTTVYGNQNQSILLTLPIDAGWHLTINGKPYPISKAYGALITFKLPRTGKNLIKLSFVPRGLKAGLIISIASLIILAILFTLQKRRQKS